MANTWWMSTLGSDAAAGSTYETARLTIAGIMGLAGLVTGDTINVVNDGIHTWPQSATPTNVKAGTKGTNFTTNVGLVIRGTDKYGHPEMVTFKPTGGNGVRSWLNIVANTGYVLLRNIKADASAFNLDINAYDFVEWDDNGTPDPGPVRLEGVAFIGAGLGDEPQGLRRLVRVDTAAAVSGWEFFELYGVYIQNATLSLTGDSAASSKTLDRVVYYVDFQATGPVLYAQSLAGASANARLTMTRCTIFLNIGNNAFNAPLQFNISGGGAFGFVTVKNNLVYLNSTQVTPQARFFTDSSVPAGESGTLDIGFNALLGGKDISSGDKATSGWYQNQWDPDQNDATGIDPYATDVEDFDLYEAEVFADPRKTFAWDPLGNGVPIILPKDLRPIIYTTIGEGGVTPGALPAFSPVALDWVRDLPERQVVERLAWLTSVVTADNGSVEQRMALRMQPRRNVEMSLLLPDEASRRAEYRRLHDAPAGRVRVPLYQYATMLTQAVSAGATKIFFDPTRTDLRDDEYVLVYRPSTDESFVFRVTTVVADGADTAVPLAQALRVTDFIVPTLEGFLDNGLGPSMGPIVGELGLGFTVSETRPSFPRPGSAAVIATFDGLNVLDRRPLADSAVGERFDRHPTVLDVETGMYDERVSWLHAFVAGSRRFTVQRLLTPGEMDYWRDFLHAVRGMREPFLAPTFREDFALAAIPSSSSVTIDVFTTNYSTVYFVRDTYKRLRLEAPNGDVLYRKVTSVLVLSGTTQRLTLDVALPGTSSWASGFKVGYLNRVRLAADTVSLTHEAALTTVELALRTTDT